MSALISQHEAHVARIERMGGPVRPPKPTTPRPLSPFNPQRIEAERLAAEGPLPAPYDYGPPIDRPVPERKWKTIAREVAVKHGVTVALMVSPKRYREVVAARFEAWWRIKRETNMSLPLIAQVFGNKDHTSVLYGIKKHQARVDAEARSALSLSTDVSPKSTDQTLEMSAIEGAYSTR